MSGIGCVSAECGCKGFKPGRLRRRQCELCGHSWVAHALSNLGVHCMRRGGPGEVIHTNAVFNDQVEVVHSNAVFDIGSLMLYGTQAVPVRLKILLDRLFSVLKQEEVIRILNALEWTLQDYIRGYVLQDSAGKVLDCWDMMTLEEEVATLQQFLRFGETKSIVELMAVLDKEGQAVTLPSGKTDSDIRIFIEQSGIEHDSIPPIGPEKPSPSNVLHYENLVNSVTFMLPFQFLSSARPPLQGSSSPGNFGLKQDPSGTALLSTSSTPLTSHIEKTDCPTDTPLVAAKEDAEDFPTSDVHSDGFPATCTIADLTQRSAEGSARVPERSSGLRKGRVICSACEKTFYDKGTLKIHYNAVHLKIKHRCSVSGCNMVFSSLRSRNRHSSNPNPRLHMPVTQHSQESAPRSGLSMDEASEGDTKLEFSPVPVVESGPTSSFVLQSGMLLPNLKTVQPVLPFSRSLVMSEAVANMPLTFSRVRGSPTSDLPSAPVTKKKSRKSSMPVKIERGAMESLERKGKSDSDCKIAIPRSDEKGPDGGHRTDEIPANFPWLTDRENNAYFVERHLDLRPNAELCASKAMEEGSRNTEIRLRDEQEGGMPCAELKDHSPDWVSTPAPQSPKAAVSEEQESGPLSDDGGAVDDEQSGMLTTGKEVSEDCDSGVPEGGHHQDASRHCKTCNERCRSQYHVRSHHRGAHLKERHLCAVAGRDTAFPSQRNRDR